MNLFVFIQQQIEYLIKLYEWLQEQIVLLFQKIKFTGFNSGNISVTEQQVFLILEQLTTLLQKIEEEVTERMYHVYLLSLQFGIYRASEDLEDNGVEVEDLDIKEQSTLAPFLVLLDPSLLFFLKRMKEAHNTLITHFELSIYDSLRSVNEDLPNKTFQNMVQSGLAQKLGRKEIMKKLTKEFERRGMKAFVKSNGHELNLASYMKTLINTEEAKLYGRAKVKTFVEKNVKRVKHKTKLDEKTCKTCGPLDGTIWTLDPNDKDFPYIDEHPGGITCIVHPNCRCEFEIESL